MNEIHVHFPSGEELTIPAGTRVEDIFRDHTDEFSGTPLAALVNNELTSLSFRVTVNATVKPVYLNEEMGMRIYRRTLSFLLAMVSQELFPDRRLIIGHSMGKGFFYYYNGFMEVPREDLDALAARMKEYVEQNLPIQRRVISYQDALEHFSKNRKHTTALLLSFRNESKIPVYVCGDYMDVSFDPMVSETGILTLFELRRYGHGFLLRYPSTSSPDRLGPFKDDPLLFSIYQEYKAWGKILNVNCAGKLNQLATDGDILGFIRVAEALHDKKISEIADRIAEQRDKVRIVLIAGPSSSGKTTFTKKLAIQLRVLGFNPLAIGLDDYFIPRDRTPLDADGKPDFESISAIDVPLLNEHLGRLFEGEEVEIPIYDFKLGNRKSEGHRLKMERRNIILMEGIHGLNEDLTAGVAEERKYRVYVSALTQLNIDDRNRVATTDNRLLRRIVRDYQFRGHSALKTLDMWPSVRRGEDRNIFPFQNNADSAFNSALDYELPVLKGLAEPMLRGVKPTDEGYTEALRLLKFLNNFVPIPAKLVPSTSILREFIGDSGFKY